MFIKLNIYFIHTLSFVRALASNKSEEEGFGMIGFEIGRA